MLVAAPSAFRASGHSHKSELHIEEPLSTFHPQPKQHDSSVLSENNTDAHVHASGPIVKLLQTQDALISYLEKKGENKSANYLFCLLPFLLPGIHQDGAWSIMAGRRK